jgi:hypothetical protein
MFNSSRHVRMERLEDRQLMAGDVAAAVVNGSLYLTEAAGQAGQDNRVLITALASGQIRVEGTGAPGATSLVNGAASQDFTVPGSLYVNFGAGKDKVEFSALGGVAKFQNVGINVGVASATGDADSDVVSLSHVETRGSLTIFTGASNDQVFVNFTTVGDGLGIDRMRVMTGAGGDVVHVRRDIQIRGDAEFQTFDSAAEADSDVLYFDNSVFVQKNLTAQLGGGADYFMAGDVSAPLGFSYSLQVNGSLNLDAGDGDDQVLMAAFNVGDGLDDRMSLRTGAGADTVTLNGRSATNLDVQTFDFPDEADADHVQMQNLFIWGDLLVETGGGDDHLFITDPTDAAIRYGLNVNGSLAVDMGDGNDAVHIEGTGVGDGSGVDDLVLYTGAGADVVKLDFSSIPVGNGQYIIPEAKGNVLIQTFEYATETDHDEVRIPVAQIYGDLNVRTGAGDDFFEMIGGNVGQSFDLDAAEGNDAGYLAGFIGHEGMVRMGDGADNLTLGFTIADILTLSGGNGVDRLQKPAVMAVDVLFQSGWEYINGRRTWFDGIFNTDLVTGVVTRR